MKEQSENNSTAVAEVVCRWPEFSIVGVGASAGSVEACSALFKNLPADTGLAFVVIQHPDPERENLLPASLARIAAIPVSAVNNETLVEPNHIYVVPPNSETLFSEGKLKLIPRGKTLARTDTPVDGFLRSLAEHCRHRAIGVVLSGAGSDGARGLESIKAAGGVTFAQETQSPGFAGMPHSAFAAGSADFVLPPGGIARKLIEIAKYSCAKKDEIPSGMAEIPPDSEFHGILTLLRDTAGVDFTHYRSGAVQRRIFRRMAIRQIVDPERYCRFLRETPGEVSLLCAEMIPRVTRFFRDPNVFAALRDQVFPKFLTGRSRDVPVRIWVPGCASGEEVYSIAISFLEFLREAKTGLPIQIFGTDLSLMAIQKARNGFYHPRIAGDVSPERLERFFAKRDGGYRINASVRNTCVFAGHDLIGDPPWSKLDLIGCRNVSIDRDSDRAPMLSLFHYALNPAGFLMPGAMETAARFPDLFAPVVKNSPVYAKRAEASRLPQSWGAVGARIASDVGEETYTPGGAVFGTNGQAPRNLRPRREGSRLFPVLFEPVPQASLVTPAATEPAESMPRSEFLKLEHEFIATREQLATMLDDHRQYSGETHSAQEESLSHLEEVQSFNEELETAREELQSANEELSTVNEELQTRIADLQQARDFAASIVETVREPLVVLDNALCVRKANRAFYRTFRLSERDTEGRVIFVLAQRAWDVPALQVLLEKILLEDKPFREFELEADFERSGRRTLRMSGERLDKSEMILLSIEDITARRHAETELHRAQDELRQGQKMEAIGRLAGGVAHDFNNMLTAILGFSEILMENVSAGSDAYLNAVEIWKAGERAAALTHQLLAFSRRQVLHPQVLSLNGVIREMSQMLRRLIADNISLDEDLGEELGQIRADPGQMSQVILNLALNARDAMPEGGVLSIRTGNVDVETGEKVRGLGPGSYVGLIVADSGSGMDPETQRHIFEPFYTTKPRGSGTGLGLATVFGIVEQSGGKIQFASQAGHGTTFWVDFPRVEATPAKGAPRESAGMPRGNETVLVVEDEDGVRGLAVQILKRQGYKVLETSKASEALAVCETYPGAIDLLLSDVVMPRAHKGWELAEQAVAIRKEMRVLLTSGCTADALALHGIGKDVSFLRKPFTLQQLVGKVRQVLDSSAADNSAGHVSGAGL